jgi:hypothetical protein
LDSGKKSGWVAYKPGRTFLFQVKYLVLKVPDTATFVKQFGPETVYIQTPKRYAFFPETYDLHLFFRCKSLLPRWFRQTTSPELLFND